MRVCVYGTNKSISLGYVHLGVSGMCVWVRVLLTSLNKHAVPFRADPCLCVCTRRTRVLVVCGRRFSDQFEGSRIVPEQKRNDGAVFHVLCSARIFGRRRSNEANKEASPGNQYVMSVIMATNPNTFFPSSPIINLIRSARCF